MIVCICNNLNEKAIDAAISGGANRPCAVFRACGTRAECGVCVPHIIKRFPQSDTAGAVQKDSPDSATKSAKPELV